MKIKDLLKYRNIWLGCAMIAIVWYHFKINLPLGPFSRLKDIGYCGVDICLFASGFGCYLSLKKDSNLRNFFKKRFFRLMPTYWLFIVFWIAFRFAFKPISVWAALGNFLGLQYLTAQGMHFNWYISGIILLYILSPLLVKLIDKGESVWIQTVIILLLLLATTLFWTHDTAIIIAVRVPVFYVGMLFGRLSMEERELKPLHICLLCVAAVLACLFSFVAMARFEDLLWSYGLSWYPFFFAAPGACVALSLMANALERLSLGRIAVGALDKIGEYSFEIYLVHLGVYEAFLYAIDCMWLPGGNAVWFAALFVTALLCVLLRRGAGVVEKLMSRVPSKT